jgi:MFS family permease
MFRSLRVFNFRLWFAGSLISNTGSWMQRTAQAWIVLTELTDYDAAAIGITTALQFGPFLVLMPVAGLLADRFDRKLLLMWTQALQCALALGLGILVVLGTVQLWQVYLFALLLGIVGAIDAPPRHAIVTQLVSDADLPNAVALNSTSFQCARLVGPALAGVLVALIGAGPVFLLNALSFGGMIVALGLIRRSQIRSVTRLPRAKGQIRDGLRYVQSRPDIVMVLFIVFVVGMFGLNFPIFIATMATAEFGQGATGFGVLSSVVAVGGIAGGLLAARRERARFGVVVLASGALGLTCLLGALAPDMWTFALALILMGATSLTMMTTANAYVQTTTAPAMRGRVIALYMAILDGGLIIGAPLVGLVANGFGARWAVGIGALSGVIAAAVAVVWLISRRGMRLGRTDTRFGLKLRFNGSDKHDRELATQEIAIAAATTAHT